MNIFLTGDIGVGKTTVLLKTLEFVNCKIGGYIEKKNRLGTKMTFKLINLNDGKSSEPIVTSPNEVEKESNREHFDCFGAKLLKEAGEKREIIVLDEIGFLEKETIKFRAAIKELLDGEKLVFGVIKNKSDEFLQEIRNREDVKLINVTKENREDLIFEIVEELKRCQVKIKKNCGFFFHRRRVDWYNESLEHPENEYPLKIVQHIQGRIGAFNNKSILEIGAGSGAIAIPLMKEGAKITTVDSSVNMYLSFYERKERLARGTENLIMKLGPWEDYEFGKFDVVISAFCSSNLVLTENLQRLLNQAKERIFIIIHSFRNRRNFQRNELMKKIGREEKKYTVIGEDIIKILKEKEMKYSIDRTELRINQFFQSEKEAYEFIKDHFNIENEEESEITKRFVQEKLVKLKNGCMLENTKYVDVIEIKI